MADFDPDVSFDSDPLLAAIRLEFSQRLPARLETMRSSLMELSRAYDPDAADAFFRAAHSLKGTAPSFGASELADGATVLAEAGRMWLAARSASSDEVTEARERLELLTEAVARFRAGIEGSEMSEAAEG